MQDSQKRKSSSGNPREIEGLPVMSTQDSSHRYWERTTLGVRSDDRGKRSGSGGFWSYDARVDPNGEVAQRAKNRIGGDGKHWSLLDCAPRGIGGRGLGGDAGRHPATGKSARARQEDRSGGL